MFLDKFLPRPCFGNAGAGGASDSGGSSFGRSGARGAESGNNQRGGFSGGSTGTPGSERGGPGGNTRDTGLNQSGAWGRPPTTRTSQPTAPARTSPAARPALPSVPAAQFARPAPVAAPVARVTGAMAQAYGPNAIGSAPMSQAQVDTLSANRTASTPTSSAGFGGVQGPGGMMADPGAQTLSRSTPSDMSSMNAALGRGPSQSAGYGGPSGPGGMAADPGGMNGPARTGFDDGDVADMGMAGMMNEAIDRGLMGINRSVRAPAEAAERAAAPTRDNAFENAARAQFDARNRTNPSQFEGMNRSMTPGGLASALGISPAYGATPTAPVRGPVEVTVNPARVMDQALNPYGTGTRPSNAAASAYGTVDQSQFASPSRPEAPVADQQAQEASRPASQQTSQNTGQSSGGFSFGDIFGGAYGDDRGGPGDANVDGTSPQRGGAGGADNLTTGTTPQSGQPIGRIPGAPPMPNEGMFNQYPTPAGEYLRVPPIQTASIAGSQAAAQFLAARQLAAAAGPTIPGLMLASLKPFDDPEWSDPGNFEDPMTNSKVKPSVRARYKDKHVPVTIRNNNVGAASFNADAVPNHWLTKLPGYVGKTSRPKAEGGHYAKFATPEHGVYAASKILEGYQRYFDNEPTVDKIVTRWAKDHPPAYKEHVLKGLQDAGFDVKDINTVVDLTNPEVRKAIIKAKSGWESGFMAPIYEDTVFDNGVAGNFGGEDTGTQMAGNVPSSAVRSKPSEFPEAQPEVANAPTPQEPGMVVEEAFNAFSDPTVVANAPTPNNVDGFDDMVQDARIAERQNVKTTSLQDVQRAGVLPAFTRQFEELAGFDFDTPLMDTTPDENQRVNVVTDMEAPPSLDPTAADYANRNAVTARNANFASADMGFPSAPVASAPQRVANAPTPNNYGDEFGFPGAPSPDAVPSPATDLAGFNETFDRLAGMPNEAFGTDLEPGKITNTTDMKDVTDMVDRFMKDGTLPNASQIVDRFGLEGALKIAGMIGGAFGGERVANAVSDQMDRGNGGERERRITGMLAQAARDGDNEESDLVSAGDWDYKPSSGWWQKWRQAHGQYGMLGPVPFPEEYFA